MSQIRISQHWCLGISKCYLGILCQYCGTPRFRDLRKSTYSHMYTTPIQPKAHTSTKSQSTHIHRTNSQIVWIKTHSRHSPRVAGKVSFIGLGWERICMMSRGIDFVPSCKFHQNAYSHYVKQSWMGLISWDPCIQSQPDFLLYS